MASIEDRVETLITSKVSELGYELYDVEYAKEGKDYYLRVFIDKSNGIDLNDCETLLKQTYDIPDNYSLIILKYEKLTGVGSNKSIQYEVYSPINFTLLNLSICENTDIDSLFRFM